MVKRQKYLGIILEQVADDFRLKNYKCVYIKLRMYLIEGSQKVIETSARIMPHFK